MQGSKDSDDHLLWNEFWVTFLKFVSKHTEVWIVAKHSSKLGEVSGVGPEPRLNSIQQDQIFLASGVIQPNFI